MKEKQGVYWDMNIAQVSSRKYGEKKPEAKEWGVGWGGEGLYLPRLLHSGFLTFLSLATP